MIVDFRNADDGLEVETDLCIVGGGPAGISMAREFIGSGVSVCLIESGGLEFDGDIQSLYEGETTGIPYFDLSTSRLRFLGGSSNHWAGWCRPLNEMDFETRAWVPDSGWPIGRADLDPFYERTLPIFDIGPMEFDAEAWTALGIEPPALDDARLRSAFWQFSPPVRFGEKYKAELEAASNIRLFLHANLVDIETDSPAATVTRIGIRSLTGKSGTVRAKTYVIACGGIENARLLLAANTVEAKGLGNRNDLVGRYFMEHMNTRTGVVMAKDTLPLVEKFVLHFRDGVPFQPGFVPSDRFQSEQRILNTSIRFDYVPDSESGTYAFREIWRSAEEGRIAGDLGSKLWSVLSDLDDVAGNVYRRVVQGRNFVVRPKFVFVTCESEQMPNPDSRVTLIDDKDALGMNRARLDWQLTDLDRRTIRRITRLFAEELGRLDLARLKIDDWLLAESGWGEDLQGGNHHMGTTRMADDPRKGVVDSDCRVHGMSNLYIAGSSVFPTGGFTTPTLTLVALALRLADHLKTRFA